VRGSLVVMFTATVRGSNPSQGKNLNLRFLLHARTKYLATGTKNCTGPKPGQEGGLVVGCS